MTYNPKSCNALEKSFYTPIEAAIRWCGLLSHEVEIMEVMQQHYEETNTLGPFAFNDDEDGFAWALQNEQSWPYFFGAVGMTWEAHAPRRKANKFV